MNRAFHAIVSVISAGRANRYKDSHSLTLKNIIMIGGCIEIVNEGIRTKIKYERKET